MRIGVCGTAHWARTVHLPALAAHPAVELVAVFGRDEERTKSLARSFGCEAFTSFEELLAKVDAVSFVVPPSVQGKLAGIAAEAGKHLILEKPLATEIAVAGALQETARTAGIGAICFLTRQFIPCVRDFIFDIQGLSPERAVAEFRSAALLDGSPYAGSPWRQEAFGALWDVAPHALSVLCPILGDVEKVSGRRHGDGTLEIEFHHPCTTSNLTINLRDPEYQFLERYSFGFDGIERVLVNREYDRVAAFGNAVDALLHRVSGSGGDDRLAGAVAIVAIVEAAVRATELGTPQRIENPLPGAWRLPAF